MRGAARLICSQSGELPLYLVDEQGQLIRAQAGNTVEALRSHSPWASVQADPRTVRRGHRSCFLRTPVRSPTFEYPSGTERLTRARLRLAEPTGSCSLRRDRRSRPGAPRRGLPDRVQRRRPYEALAWNRAPRRPHPAGRHPRPRISRAQKPIHYLARESPMLMLVNSITESGFTEVVCVQDVM